MSAAEPSPQLLATCWTTAGSAIPRGDELSPIPVEERIAAVAATGWSGLGLSQDDLRAARDRLGLPRLRELVADAGLRHTEVELIVDWWRTDAPGSQAMRDLLLDAARELGARHVKVGPPPQDDTTSWPDLVSALRALARLAGDVRLALEPVPFSTIGSLPLGAALVAEVGEPNLGLLVDAWHVFRAGTSLEELEACLAPGTVFGVELDDADAEPVGDLFEDTIRRRHYVGQGAFDLDGFVEVLAGAGFAGPWGVEILSDTHRARPLLDGLRTAHDTADTLLRRVLAR